MKKRFYIFILAGILFAACQDTLTDGIIEEKSTDYIRVAGMVTNSSPVSIMPTRATEKPDTVRAETVDWLKGALRAGLDITYSNINSDGSYNTDNEKVAKLVWTGGVSEANPPRGEYTFQYKGSNPLKDAEWYDNGPHYFEGQYVPAKLRSTSTDIPADLVRDQHDESDYTYTVDEDGNESVTGNIGNYTLLSHYIGMPPNWTASATVDQLLLPFKHRLARVIAYILIDEDLKNLSQTAPASLEGYKLEGGKDNPANTKLYFDSVQVLDMVVETAATATTAATLTPSWTMGRRVIPHFFAEFNRSVNLKGESVLPSGASAAETNAANEAFIVYIDKHNEKKIHPRDDEWYDAHKNYVADPAKSAYIQKKYHKVPVYDLIVRPTYSTAEAVMYDEEGYYSSTDKTVNTSLVDNLVKANNKIVFEMTLDNNLVYKKTFEFDLNANQQTSVYITIDRESIDYDESISESWVATDTNDGRYGVNNDLGHNMSVAGSSWQRAVTYCESEPQISVTDGNYYDDDRVDEGDLGQYFKDTDQWLKEFFKATEQGDRHGHYFVLEKDIEISVQKIPEPFIFTGHLDGRGHKIILENGSGSNYIFDGLDGIYTTPQEGENYTGEWKANVHKETYSGTTYWVPVAGYRAEILNTTVEGGYMFSTSAVFSETVSENNSETPTVAPTVTGYVYNCFDANHNQGNPLTNIVPIPQY